MKIYNTVALVLLLATTAAHADIQCGGFRIGVGDHRRLFSLSDTGKYREYQILKVDGNKTLAKTQYGTVTVSLTDIPTVVWINTKGETSIQVCSYIDKNPLPEPKLPDFHAITPTNRDPWTTLVDKVIAISSKQNNGAPKIAHFCEAEFKQCSDVISYVSTDGFTSALQVHKTANGDVIDRLVCKLNKTEDVRTCVDFDSHGKTTSMKDIHGGWTDIASDESGE